MIDALPENRHFTRQSTLETLVATRQRSLVALCYRLTGDPDAAEDLAQETLYEAWRNLHKLHDPSGAWPWLAGIARNVCLRWGRARGRQQDCLASADRATGMSPVDDDYDLDVELERRELADLLDRALALLPPQDRAVLIERYARESPHAEIARRLGLAEGLVAKRIERGRLKLKRILSTDFIREAACYGLVGSDPDGWQETTIWCTVCGTRRLHGRFTAERVLQLICVGCAGCPYPIAQYVDGACKYGRFGEPLATKGFKPSLSRLFAREYERLRDGILGRTVDCPRCGTEACLYPGAEAATVGRYFVGADCPRCGRVLVHTALCFLALGTPEGRKFWRAHPRIRTLPSRETEAGGVPAVVTAYESLTDGARFAAVFARDTFKVLDLYGHSQE